MRPEMRCFLSRVHRRILPKEVGHIVRVSKVLSPAVPSRFPHATPHRRGTCCFPVEIWHSEGMFYPQPIVERQINEVPISMDNIEQALLHFAIPGMYGSVRIRLKLLPTAAQEMVLGIEHRTVTKLDV